MSAILLLIAIMAAANVEAYTCNRKVDLLLAVDASSTICDGTEPCEKWAAILQFCKNIASSFHIGLYQTRVAFITFDNTTTVQWNLQEYRDEDSLLTAIGNIKYVGGEFIEVVSPSRIITDVFNPMKGDRDLLSANVINMAIEITDGSPNFPDDVYITEALTVQATRQVVVFMVCHRPGCQEHQARGMASYPQKVNETYFFVDNYLDIDQVRENLVNKMCDY